MVETDVVSNTASQSMDKEAAKDLERKRAQLERHYNLPDDDIVIPVHPNRYFH